MSNGSLRTKLYVDADILLNYFLDEMVGNIPAGYYAERLLVTAAAGSLQIVLSDLTMKELEKHGVPRHGIERLMDPLKRSGCLEVVEVSQEDVEEGKRLSSKHGVHLSDSIHAAVAIGHGCVLVTRNLRHFGRFSSILSVMRPEDLL